MSAPVKPIQSQLNAWREARKQRLLAKLLRANPKASVAALETLVGFTSSVPPTAPKKSCMQHAGKENLQPFIKKPSEKQVRFDSKDSKPVAVCPVTISNPKQLVPPSKPLSSRNETQKGKFVIRSTATSLRRETMATEGVKIARPESSRTTIKRSVSFREPPLGVKTPTRKLTIPITPDFARPRERIRRVNIPSHNASKQSPPQKPPTRTSTVTKHLPRRSVSVAPRKSVFYEFRPQQPEKEKVRQWLDKRGRSTSSCRHVSCMGYSLQEIEQIPSSSTPTIKRPTLKPRASVAVPTSKPRVSFAKEASTTLKETEDQQPLVATESNPADPVKVFSSPVPEAPANCEIQETRDEPEKLEDKVEEIASGCAAEAPGTATEERDLVTGLKLLDINPPTEKDLVPINNTEQLLRTILLLLDQPQYPEEKILHWMRQASSSFPEASNHALFWEVRARLAELRGDVDKALSLYKEALASGAGPIAQLEQHFEDFLKRMPDSLPAGQRSPVANTLGAPDKHHGSLRTPRRPLLDASQIFQSSAIRYELKIMRILKMDESEKSRYLATPVRRSTRPKSVLGTAERNKVFYVDDLKELSPATKENVEIRQNAALFYI